MRVPKLDLSYCAKYWILRSLIIWEQDLTWSVSKVNRVKIGFSNTTQINFMIVHIWILVMYKLTIMVKPS